MVRAYFPQRANRSIITNTNNPPQGSQINGVVPPIGDTALVQTTTLSALVQTGTLSALVQTFEVP